MEYHLYVVVCVAVILYMFLLISNLFIKTFEEVYEEEQYKNDFFEKNMDLIELMKYPNFIKNFSDIVLRVKKFYKIDNLDFDAIEDFLIENKNELIYIKDYLENENKKELDINKVSDRIELVIKENNLFYKIANRYKDIDFITEEEFKEIKNIINYCKELRDFNYNLMLKKISY